jgi:hypothetical protein
MYKKYIMFSYPQSEPLKSAYSLERSTNSRIGYGTNNLYQNMPSRMTDSRSLIAAHQPEAILNENILKQNNIQSNWEYRKYLTENSQKIAQENFKEACNDAGYFQRFTPDERGYQNEIHQTPSQTQYKENSTILQEQSDLKQLYLSRDDLQKQKTPVVLTQDQLFSQLSK